MWDVSKEFPWNFGGSETLNLLTNWESYLLVQSQQ